MMNYFFKNGYSFVRQYVYAIILFVFLSTLSIQLRTINFFSILFIISLILFLHLLTKFNKIVTIPILLILALPLIYDSIFAFVFGYQPTLGIFYSILETSSDEATGVLSMIALPVLILFCAISFLLIKCRTELQSFKLKKKYSLIIIFAIWIIIIPFTVFNKFRKSDEYKFQRSGFYLLSVQHIVEAKYPLIINDIVSYLSYRAEINKFEKYKTTKKITPNGILAEPGKGKATKVIVMVGESNAQSYFSLYGYKEAITTPFLDSLYMESNTPLSIFEGLASATLTRDAVPFALTFMTPQNRNVFNSNKNIIDLAKDNGYSTSWISNQEQMGIYDTSIGLISTSSDTIIFNGKKDIDDLNLVKQLSGILTSDASNQLGIVHLISSHVPYEYTDAIDEKAINVEEDETGKLNDYLRCIHHTDRVVEAVYKLMSSRSDNFVILYFSDHGEFLPKNHGFVGEDADAQLPIPLFCINKSPIDVSGIIKNYADPQSGRVNNSNIAYIITEIMGYNVADILKEDARESSNLVFMANNKVVNYLDLLKSNGKLSSKL